MKAGIAIDAWKLPVFEAGLREAGFEWENKGPFTPGTIMLHVETNNGTKLEQVVRECNNQCRRMQR